MSRKKKTESGWAIPHDWSGEEWSCWRIKWPKSPQYELLLRSLIFTLTRGHDWDKYTGSVIGAQVVGWQIFNANEPLEACKECDNDGSGGGVGAGGDSCGGILVDDSEGDMGQVVTDVTVENGVLTVWFGPCCSRELTGFSALVDQSVPDEPLKPPTGSSEFSACGKAYAIMDIVNKVVEGGYDALDESPWNYISTVENFTGYDLKNNYVLALIASWAAIVSGFGFGYGDLYDAAEQQTILCKIQALFGDDAVGVDQAKFDQIYGIVLGEFGVNVAKGALWSAALNAVGVKTMDTIAKLGAYDVSRDCGCEGGSLTDGETAPDENGWYLSRNLAGDVTVRAGDGGGTMYVYLQEWIETHDVYGVYYRVSAPPTVGDFKSVDQSGFGAIISTYVEADVNVAAGASHLEDKNQAYPFMQCSQDAVGDAIAAARGYAGWTKLSGGVDAVGNIASPEWAAGDTGGFIMSPGTPELYGVITELRWIQNTNSPSHS